MVKIAYISDIHLEFISQSLQKKGKSFSVDAMAEMFANEVNKISCDFSVLAGDVSHSCFDVISFLTKVDRQIDKPLYVCLGNHDYWNWQSTISENQYMIDPPTVWAIEEYYKMKFKEFKNIKLLFTGEKFIQNDIAIIGDCGFSAYNSTFNCGHGVYRNTIRSLQQEKELSDRWLKFFLQEIRNGSKCLIVTHTPPADWGSSYSDIGQNERFYIFGHVHDIDNRNTDLKIIKQDNYHGDAANGYYKDNFEFKILEI